MSILSAFFKINCSRPLLFNFNHYFFLKNDNAIKHRKSVVCLFLPQLLLIVG